ncbi:MAG: outer membrane beta-barrel protein [Rickettsiales bacterium]|jgi:opacity protein-like surface antigen|nr:outer membrane beta-barrel protein [Rickettsiales bacterium]
MKLFSLTLAALLGLFAVSASAQERSWPNWYVGLHARVAWIDSTEVSVNDTNIGDLEFDNGFGGGASLGYMPGGDSFLRNTRFEFEYDIAESDIDSLNGFTASDNLRTNSYMGNVFYDIPTGTQFVPYVGAGVGVSRVDINAPAVSLNDSDTVFAYQFMGGLGYSPTSFPNTTLTVGYRYFATEDPEFTVGTAGVDHELSSHNAEVGARFAF